MARCLHTHISLGLLTILVVDAALLCFVRHKQLSQGTVGVMTPVWLLSKPSIAWFQLAELSFYFYICTISARFTLRARTLSMPWCMQIYPITMASWIFGRKPPSSVNALAVLHKSGVDVTSLVNLK